MRDDPVIIDFPAQHIKCPVGSIADHPSLPPYVEVIQVMGMERVICWEVIISEEYPDDFEEKDWGTTAPILEIEHLWAKVHVGELREITKSKRQQSDDRPYFHESPDLHLVWSDGPVSNESTGSPDQP